MVRKTPKHSTKPKRVTKKQARREMDAELSIYQCDERFWSIPEELVTAYGDDLLLMISEDPKMIHYQNWKKKHKLTKGRIDHYLQKFPKFKARWIEAKEQLAWRIWERGLNREADSNMTRFSLPYFSETFKEMEEWRNYMKTKTAEAQKPTLTIVEMPTFQSSGKVPDKIDKPNKESDEI